MRTPSLLEAVTHENPFSTWSCHTWEPLLYLKLSYMETPFYLKVLHILFTGMLTLCSCCVYAEYGWSRHQYDIFTKLPQWGWNPVPFACKANVLTTCSKVWFASQVASGASYVQCQLHSHWVFKCYNFIFLLYICRVWRWSPWARCPCLT